MTHVYAITALSADGNTTAYLALDDQESEVADRVAKALNGAAREQTPTMVIERVGVLTRHYIDEGAASPAGR
ncbi:hypothetical protein [Nocardia wallacei]|uniref:hypothetical protein n=1 Tax=Nocardia wallacei TaxID=480035 RepID=UPI0024540A6C|nr:hypothetical protein [Nocardia wallacei]